MQVVSIDYFHAIGFSAALDLRGGNRIDSTSGRQTFDVSTGGITLSAAAT